ncbi:MAG: DinB family protein [Gemmatimonadota bacterium]|nr:DinB family protein [Gemmatimonadota bacterium]MDE3006100.1 DinB family protein [Gemmatimonadota bacterium]MDE3013351.1 DinB family protein [Gemmatimonadota bacterium]
MEFSEISPFLEYFERVRGRTRAVAECVPEEHLEWRPAEGRFSPGDLIRHVAAAERWMWGENVQFRPSRYPGHGPELASGKQAVLAYMDQAHAETVAILSTLEPEQLDLRCETVGGIEMRVWKWLRLMVEHQIHHRGQLYELLGQIGVEVPPLYGLTEPQVRERSLDSLWRV